MKKLFIFLFLLIPLNSFSEIVPCNEPKCNKDEKLTLTKFIEAKENNNIRAVSEPLESPSPFLDVAGQIVGKTALPFVVILLTLSLLGVVYFVGKGRREEVNKRLNEQSSLISVLESKE